MRISRPGRAFMVSVAAIIQAIALPSCNNLSKEEHLPAEEMQKILLDLNIAESYSAMVKDSVHYRPGAKNADSLAVYYKAIFAHHKITKEIFDKSLAWYKANPTEMDSLFSSMIPVVTGWQDTTKK